MKKIQALLLLLLTFTILMGCKKWFIPECEEPITVSDSFLNLSFKDFNGTYLHKEVNPILFKDSLKIKDEGGNFYPVSSSLNLIPNTSSLYWEFNVRPIFNSNTDNSAYENTICKKFIIFYNHNSTDTITTCFKASKTKCGSIFSNLKVYYKGNLINEVNDGTGVSCLIIKN